MQNMYGQSRLNVKDSIISQSEDDHPVAASCSKIKKSKNTMSTIENNNNPTASEEPVVHNDVLNKSGDAQEAPIVNTADGDQSFSIDQSFSGDHSEHVMPEAVEHELSEAVLQDALTKLSGADVVNEEVLSNGSSLKVILEHILSEQKKIGFFVQEISKKTSKKNLLLTVSNSFSHITIYLISYLIDFIHVGMQFLFVWQKYVLYHYRRSESLVNHK
jgi:hypothetical protein